MAEERIEIGPGVVICEDDLTETFVRSSGPGGQNVNKLSTAVELRLRPRACTGLPERVVTRLLTAAGSRLTKSGEIVIRAERFRTQEANRKDARDRLAAKVRAAMIEAKIRKKTSPTRSSKERRLEGKRQRSETKARRRTRIDER